MHGYLKYGISSIWLCLFIYTACFIDYSTQQAFCGGVPKAQGNFTFTASPFPGSFKVAYLYENVVINCTTNVKNAGVNASAYESSVWDNIMTEKTNFPNVVKTDQAFIIMSVTDKNKLLYRCNAKYDGKEICMFVGGLNVFPYTRDVKISIIPTMRPITAVEGDHLQFFCEADGYGSKEKSALKWYKKTSTGRVELDKSLVLRQGYTSGGHVMDKELVSIKNVKMSDSGEYICVRDHKPTGTIKSESVKVEIEAATKPFVRLIPSAREVKVQEKQNVKVVCTYVSGLPKPTMKWRDPSGKVIHDCDQHNINCTLQLYDIKSAKNHGRYTCEAANYVGNYNIDVFIDVLMPVQLQKPWKQEIAGFEDQPELTCAISIANPLPTITWYYQFWSCASSKCKPDDKLWTSVFSKVSVVPAANVPTNVSKLVVPTSRVSGFYSCHADNNVGKDSYNITLHRVENVPTTFKLSSFQTTINMNESFQLNCTAAANVYGNLEWLKNGIKLIEEPGRITFKNIDTADFLRIKTLTVSRLIMSDSANYTCVGYKRTALDTSRIISQLIVKALTAPSIILSPNIILNQTNKNAVITCDVSGNPFPLVTWKFEKKPISFVDSLTSISDCATRTEGIYRIGVNMEINQLVICHMNFKKHQGEYKCIAKNKVQTVKKKTNVFIFAKPKILKWDGDVSFETGKTVYLVCEAEGNPSPNITLLRMKDGEMKPIEEVEKYGNGTAYVFIKSAEKESSGQYICLANNIYGEESRISYLKPAAQSSSTKVELIPKSTIAIIIVCVILFVIIVIAVACWHKRKVEKKFAPYLAPNANFQLDPDRSLFEQSGELPYDPDWEFPRERLNFVKMIGSGAFGEVWLAEAQGILILDPRDKGSIASKRRTKVRNSQRYTHLQSSKKNKSVKKADISFEKTMVAVKTLKGDASDTEYKDLASELKILIHIGENKHIVNLLGACTRAGKLSVILEYCPHGSLLVFLRERREMFETTWFKNETDMGNELTYIDLTMVGFQVAKGMDFLASKKCVHRDLAARNVLIGVDYIVKIADFGLARDIYKDEFYMKSTSGLLPVKWMAPESLFDKVYTSQSDVWSFGIVLWEIFTLGGSPYPSLPTEDLFSYLEQGRRMDQPDLCPLEIYAIMRDCWERNPNDRPLFSQTADRIGQILSNHAGNENSYLRFDKDDGGPFDATDAVESDYLLPVEKKSTKNDEYIGITGNNDSNEAARGEDTYDASFAPNYQNEDDIRLNMLSSVDDDATDYANTNPHRRISDFNEAVV